MAEADKRWSLAPEVRAVLGFLSEVAQQKEEEEWDWWHRPDNAPPSKRATLPNTMALWARRDVGKSAILRRAVDLWNDRTKRISHGFKGGKLRYPSWPFRADAIRGPEANVPVAVLGWLRESLNDKRMGRNGDTSKLNENLTEAANVLLKSDIASEYAAIGEALEEQERKTVLREARESTYVWGQQVRGPLKEFFSGLRGGDENVVLLPFDDLDISPTVGYQVLETIRLLFSDHPGVAVVACGDYITLDAAIRAQLAKRAELEPGLLLVFAEQYIRKVVPRPIWIPRWKREETEKLTEAIQDILAVDWNVISEVRVPEKDIGDTDFKKLNGLETVTHLHNAPRVAVLMNWLWKNFGFAWIDRAKLDLDEKTKAALGLMICRLVSGQITGCETIQSLIDYPHLIAKLGSYLEPWKVRSEEENKKRGVEWIPCEDGAWIIKLKDLMEEEERDQWQLIQALVRWDPSSELAKAGWRAKRRLNDWVCKTLYEASNLAKPRTKIAVERKRNQRRK